MNGKIKNLLGTRNAVAIGGGALLALIGLMGMMMGWSLYFISFKSYPYFFQLIFSLGTAAIIEGALFWFGVQIIKAAATYFERGWAIFSAAVVLTIIGLNISAHNAMMRGAQLAPWQDKYVNYFGPAVIIIIAALVIVQLVSRPEVQAQFRDAMREFEVKERVDLIEDEVLQSEEFERWMKTNFKQEMFERAARRAGFDPARHQLPPAAIEAVPAEPTKSEPRQSFQPPTVDAQIVEPQERKYIPWVPDQVKALRNGQNERQNGVASPNGHRH